MNDIQLFTGNGSAPVCTRMGCRVRMERLLQSNLSGGEATFVQPTALITFLLTIGAVFAANI